MAADFKQLLGVQGRRFLNILRWCGSRSPVVAGLQFYVTQNCNLLCSMCDIGQRNRARAGLDHTGIELEVIERGLREVAGWFPRPRIHFMGGEPLMYKHLGQAAALCRELGFWWGFTTNGWFLDRDAEMLVDTRCSALNVSVDGPPEIHNVIRGAPRSFQKAATGLRHLRDLKARRGVDTPAVAVNCVINSENQHHLDEVVSALADTGVQTLNFQHLIWGDAYNADTARQIVPDVLRSFMDRVEAGEFGFSIRFYPPLAREKLAPYYGSLHDPSLGSACALPWLVLRVDQYGNAWICMQKLGNLREQTLAQMWNGREAREMRRRVLDTPLFHNYCYRCCHRQY